MQNGMHGVCILTSPRVETDINRHTIHDSKEGQIIATECEIRGKKLFVINLYAPNKDDVEFFRVIFNKHCQTA